jgi:predicted AAA+ superfamily ATPase
MATVTENKRLLLKDMYFGHINAKHEMLNNTVEERENFRKSFLVPNNVDFKKFQDGDRYFTYGLKGTGKTALLRYLSTKLEDEQYFVSSGKAVV